MKQFPFKKIDAFTNGSSSGNPAGVVYLSNENEMSEPEMLQIAKEVKLFINEVGYLSPAEDTDFRLRYFSAEREVDFCGHAAIAIMFDLISHSEEFRTKKEISIRTNKGVSTVYNRTIEGEGVFISAPEPTFSPKRIDAETAADYFGISVDQLHPELPIELVNGGLWTLIVPLADLKTTLDIVPTVAQLKPLCESVGADIIIVVTEETSNPDHRFRTRVFPPTFGYAEDPATGSGNAALGYYLKKHKKWDGGSMSIEQNDSPINPNIVKLCIKNDRVLFGGEAAARIAGTYFI